MLLLYIPAFLWNLLLKKQRIKFGNTYYERAFDKFKRHNSFNVLKEQIYEIIYYSFDMYLQK